MTIRARLATFVVALLALAGLAPFTSAAHAADDPIVRWGVATAPTDQGKGRANYSYELDPGETLTDAMVVSNNADKPLTLDVYAADGFTTKTGALDLLPRDQKSKDLGLWVDVRKGEVTIPAKDSLRIPFTVRVPKDATPGDHTGGIVTSLPVAQKDQGINVDRRLGIRMHVRVAGELKPAMTIDGLSVQYDGSAIPFASGSATVSYTVTNAGNVRIDAGQIVRLSGLFGAFGTGAKNLDPLPELLPGESFPVRVKVGGVSPTIRTTAEVTLRPSIPMPDGTFKAQSRVVETASTAAIPWSTLLLLVIVVVVVLLYRRNAKKRKAAEEARVQAAVDAALAEQSETR